MTEASGLTRDEARLESASRGTQASQFETQLRSSVARVAGQLRQTTLEAPLRSLCLAFILGYGSPVGVDRAGRIDGVARDQW
jgi:hypothetical protein